MFFRIITVLLLFRFCTAHYNPAPTPTLPFTAAAFQSPYPPGTGGAVTGFVLYASGGFFYAGQTISGPKPQCGQLKGGKCPAGDETVLWVDREGHAFLDSADPQQVYIDTATGALAYLTPASTPPNKFAPGANTVNFLHLGQGTNLTTPTPGEPSTSVSAGPGSFVWTGTNGYNPSWFLCPQPATSPSVTYQVMKEVDPQAQAGCLSGLVLVAIDYSGASPAVGLYL